MKRERREMGEFEETYEKNNTFLKVFIVYHLILICVLLIY